MKIVDKSYDVLEKKLDLEVKRHAALAGNVANAETPGFRAGELDFAGSRERALGNSTDKQTTTHPRHISLSTPDDGARIVLDNTMEVGADGNNVDLDITMGKLMSNARSYGNTVDLLAGKFRLLRIILGLRGGV